MQPAKLTLNELQQLKWILGVSLALLSCWALSGLDIQGGSLLVGAAALSAGTLLFPARVSRIPRFVWRVAAPLLALLVGADILFSIPDFIPPLVRMVACLLLYRVFAPRGRREDLQLVLLCLFCLVITGVLTVSLLFAVQLALFTPIAMGLLMVVNLLDREAEKPPAPGLWDRFRWEHLVRRVWGVLDFRFISLGSAVFVLIALVSSLIFFFTPRFDLQQAIPLMELAGQARSGFSEEVGIGDVSEITRDESVAFRVDVPSLDAVVTKPYWRMVVLDRYEDGRFTLSRELRAQTFGKDREAREFRGWTGEGGGTAGVWTFYFEGGISRYLPLPPSYARLRFQGPEKVSRLAELRLVNLVQPRQSVLFYQIDGLSWKSRFPASAREVAAFARADQTSAKAAGAGDDVEYPMTTLEVVVPDEDRGFLRELVEELRGQAPEAVGAESFAKVAGEYLRGRFRYSLSPDGGGGEGDPVVNWLRTGSRGHCEYFAGALALVLREAGYPARLVAGFAGGGWNGVEDYFVARNSDAHAWVEVYDEASRDWVRLDPTPGGGPLSGESAFGGGGDFEQGWLAWVDSLRIQWYRRIVNFDEAAQAELMSVLAAVVREWAVDLGAFFRRMGDRMLAWFDLPWTAVRWRDAAMVVAVLLLGAVLWHLRHGMSRRMRRALRRAPVLDPVRARAGRLRARLRAAAPRARSEDSMVRRNELLGALDRIRFGPDPLWGKPRRVFADTRRFLRRH